MSGGGAPGGGDQGGGQELLRPGHTYATLTDKISSLVLTRGTRRGWVLGFIISFLLFMLMMVSVTHLLAAGVGVWGINQPVGWGFAIINFVWWIGIGHAGTLISAILLLLRQKWRTSINRFAEAMTLFAVACAGLFPLLHLGRPHLFYWLFPYPNTMGVWPQFRSPLVWDVFAILTYGTVSLLFWYVGLIPDLATMRDSARRSWVKAVYGILAMGWRGSAVHWYRYEMAYLLLAGLATPLVVSVHSIVGLDFAVSLIPGWHATIFPPYFVAGAVYSGFAMVLTLAIPLRKFYGLQDFITDRHLNNMAKVMLVTGLIVAYGYMTELFTAWYSGNIFEMFTSGNRMQGPYAPAYWALLAINAGVVQLLWLKKVRRSAVALFVLSLVINAGMWLERYVIVVTSLHRDFLPSSWGLYEATFWDWGLFLGSLGLFFTLIFLFVRFLPAISVFEMRELLRHEEKPGEGDARAAAAEPAAPAEEVGAGHRAEGPCWGLLAEFEGPESLLAATRRVREEGYRRVDAYTPFPVKGLASAVGPRRARLARWTFVGGLVGGLTGFFMQYWTMAVDYPLNVGGKPLNSWPAFVPITFELAILGAALTAVVGLIVMNRLPQPYHPLFNVPGFERASRDGFFLCVKAEDPHFERERTRRLLEGLQPRRVEEVEP